MLNALGAIRNELFEISPEIMVPTKLSKRRYGMPLFKVGTFDQIGVSFAQTAKVVLY